MRREGGQAEEVLLDLAPGKILTGKGGREDDPAWREHWLARTPYPRLGAPNDVAHAALFFASDEARYVNGTNLVVDGGRTASSSRTTAHLVRSDQLSAWTASRSTR